MKKTFVFFLIAVAIVSFSQELTNYVISHKNVNYKIISEKNNRHRNEDSSYVI